MLELFVGLVGALAGLNILAATVDRRDIVLSWGLVSIIWVIFAGNDMNPDYAAYAALYGQIERGQPLAGTSAFEPGFTLLMFLAVKLGLEYSAFVVATSTIGLGLIHRTVCRIPGAANYVYPLYLVYPLLYDVVQLRNFLALAMIVFGLGILVDGGRWRVWRFIGCLGLGISFHFTAIFYVVSLIPGISRRRIGAWPVVVGIVGSTIALTFASSTTEVINRGLDSFSGDGRYQSYLETRAELEFIIPLTLQIWGLVMIWVALRAILSAASVQSIFVGVSDRTWVVLALNLCLLSFLVLPLYTYGSNFWRIPRNLHLLYYIAFFLGQRALIGRGWRRFAYNASVACYCLSALFLYSDESLIGMLIQNNFILKTALGGP